MSGEWQGWQKWDKYMDAGIVEDNVDFSDEPIIVDHAVGRTKKAIGKCWPMDAAVAYTLMKAGPDVELKWADMINLHTKMAAVIMTRKVAYGDGPDPTQKSCGHDEVFAELLQLAKPNFKFLENRVSISWDTGWSSKYMSTWLDNYDASEDVKALADVRVDRSGYPLTSKEFVYDEYFKPLKEFIIEHIKSMDEYVEGMHIVMANLSENMIKSRQTTRGKCKWADTEKAGTCAHHNPKTKKMWALIRGEDESFRTIYRRQQCYEGWNSNQFRNQFTSSKIKHTNVVTWESVQRSMADAIPDDEVLTHIRESLARMLKRKDNIVTKVGRGKNSLHKWSDWGWLAEMLAHVKNTSSKNRKAGDIVNGWKYTKINSRHSYGHEIAEFIWKPVDELKDFVVGRKEPDAYSWNSASGIMTNYRFATKQDVVDFMTALHELHQEATGHYAQRSHEGIEKTELGQWSVRSIPVKLSMYGRVDPEDYLSPQELLTLFRHASREVLAEHKPNLHESPSYKIQTTQPKEEQG